MMWTWVLLVSGTEHTAVSYNKSSTLLPSPVLSGCDRREQSNTKHAVIVAGTKTKRDPVS